MQPIAKISCFSEANHINSNDAMGCGNFYFF
jgi:hypothetical protein